MKNNLPHRLDKHLLQQSSIKPYFVEGYLSENGERWTNIQYTRYSGIAGNSAEKIMLDASKLPGILADEMMWFFVLPHLANHQEDIHTFWKNYNRSRAKNDRKKAIHGTKFYNRSDELALLGAIKEFKALAYPADVTDCENDNELAPLTSQVNFDPVFRQHIINGLKDKIVDWVTNAVWSDNEAPKRLHDILKNKASVKSDYADQPTVAGRFYNAFIQLVTSNWSLPTKKEVRNTAGFGDSPNDFIAANESFQKLGLQGLPQG